jgi:hypothetical protein
MVILRHSIWGLWLTTCIPVGPALVIPVTRNRRVRIHGKSGGVGMQTHTTTFRTQTRLYLSMVFAKSQLVDGFQNQIWLNQWTGGPDALRLSQKFSLLCGFCGASVSLTGRESDDLSPRRRATAELQLFLR